MQLWQLWALPAHRLVADHAGYRLAGTGKLIQVSWWQLILSREADAEFIISTPWWQWTYGHKVWTSSMDDSLATILGEMSGLLEQVASGERQEMRRRLLEHPRLFAYATGRSGFYLRTFIMRLNHLGHNAYYVGEASTPPLGPGDALLLMSGSGSTATSLGAAREAQALGCTVYALVGDKASPMGQLASLALSYRRHTNVGYLVVAKPVKQTTGSLFEQCALMILESWVFDLFQVTGGDRRAALTRHDSRMLKNTILLPRKAPGATCSRHFPRLFRYDSLHEGVHAPPAPCGCLLGEILTRVFFNARLEP